MKSPIMENVRTSSGIVLHKFRSLQLPYRVNPEIIVFYKKDPKSNVLPLILFGICCQWHLLRHTCSKPSPSKVLPVVGRFPYGKIALALLAIALLAILVVVAALLFALEPALLVTLVRRSFCWSLKPRAVIRWWARLWARCCARLRAFPIRGLAYEMRWFPHLRMKPRVETPRNLVKHIFGNLARSFDMGRLSHCSWMPLDII